ncbi:GntR family transcriptional regulator [Xanthobacteraceae bacterium Astr-EGSB]|uniref:GntR family transcriptional regulator n=1 Tax=Astrobacterium formosum TaxID=3069710 RepID=UPI0027B4B0D1|nr:GntR family transcriptional regulator [Xanthobacteraceae bacterium Astr-EGSB]
MPDTPDALALDKTSLGERAAERLRDEILSGRIEPGARLNLEDYKARWEISITPLRDACKQLEADGLVTVVPRRGVFVATIDKDALFEIFEIRIALEPLIAELATPHVPLVEVERVLAAHHDAARIATVDERVRRLGEIDHLVHDLVLRHCPNTRLARIMLGLRDSIIWCQNSVRRSMVDAVEPSLREHIAICEALRSKDGARVREAMNDHLLATRSRTRHALERQGDAFPKGPLQP